MKLSSLSHLTDTELLLLRIQSPEQAVLTLQEFAKRQFLGSINTNLYYMVESDVLRRWPNG